MAELAKRYQGGMYWKKDGGYEYLVKTHPDNRQMRMGRRSTESEKIYEDFTSRKKQVEERLRTIKQALQDAERLNKALRVGRTPTVVVDILNALEDANLGPHFVVVGTHTLYAYEAAASVRIQQAALATLDVDLLWDARKRVKFLDLMVRDELSILTVLQKADKTFERKESQLQSAVNAKGFEVEFLRRTTTQGDPHPFRFSADEDDLWPIQAERASVLTVAPRFEQLVISTTGKMAIMRTISPETFVMFKQWLAKSAKHREPAKRRRDELQAEIVQGLLDEGLLIAGK